MAVEICNLVLTILAATEILFKLYVAFLHDREVLLFDNRYDVPESVRNQSRFSSLIGLSKSSDNNSPERLPGMQIPGFFFLRQPASNESLILAQN
ncbi:MAG: hypothetical protein ABSG69_17655, partial [Candidatus Acidiferrum sp.]